MFGHNQFKKYSPNHVGFTLIELMVVVAIIAILAAIVLPNYSKYIAAAHRTEAQAAMLDLAQYLERQYNASFNYPASDNIPDSLTAPANVSTYYEINVIVDDSKQTYIIEAEPTAQQNDSQCGTLKLNEQGVKSPTTSGCWK